jgi:hypothetical protein
MFHSQVLALPDPSQTFTIMCRDKRIMIKCYKMYETKCIQKVDHKTNRVMFPSPTTKHKNLSYTSEHPEGIIDKRFLRSRCPKCRAWISLGGWQAWNKSGVVWRNQRCEQKHEVWMLPGGNSTQQAADRTTLATIRLLIGLGKCLC